MKQELKNEIVINFYTEPVSPRSGEETKLIFKIEDSQGDLITQFKEHHRRIAHLFIISENLEIIGHIHPEDFPNESDEKLEMRFTFPYGGRYLLGLDFTTLSPETQVSKSIIIHIDGELQKPKNLSFYSKRSFNQVDVSGDSYTGPINLSQSGEYEIEMISDQIFSGENIDLEFTIKKSGEIINLNPYLQSRMHSVIVKENLSNFVHLHSNHHPIKDKFPAKLSLNYTFPEPGIYAIFNQVRKNDHLISFRFLVKVR